MLAVVGAPRAAAVTLPANFTQSTYGTALGPVTAMAFAPDGRLFVAAQDGTVRIVKSTGTVATPFVKLAVDHQGERGLTGIAIDPNFATNGYVYLYYATATAPIHNTVSRLVADGDVAQRVDGVPVQTTIFDLEASSTTANIHNGGAMDFGTDGKLYVAVGDNARGANGQSMTTTFGKLLRINRDGTIPTDNPFYATATGPARAIYSLGLRNPFTFGIQPGSGRTFINDVGASTWEEINEAKRGSNHGWSLTEGPTTDPRFASPIYAYHHTTGTVTGCAITGGTFYNPESARYPADYLGDYFFADFCGHWIKRFDPATGTVTNFAGSTAIHPVDLKVGPDGNLYYLSRGTSSVIRVNYTASLAPTIDTHPADQTVSAGDPVTFSVEATGAGLSYQWQRDDVDIAGATSESLRLAAV
nr:PQQ-dependent sugar dehydrogenase [uncultured Friedmanniella sp.]